MLVVSAHCAEKQNETKQGTAATQDSPILLITLKNDRALLVFSNESPLASLLQDGANSILKKQEESLDALELKTKKMICCIMGQTRKLRTARIQFIAAERARIQQHRKLNMIDPVIGNNTFINKCIALADGNLQEYERLIAAENQV